MTLQHPTTKEMTHAMTAQTKPKINRRGKAQLVRTADTKGVKAIGVVAHDGHRTNLVDHTTGQPLMQPGRKLAKDAPDIAQPGLVGDGETIARILWQIEHTDAEAVVVSQGATRAWCEANQPRTGPHAAKAAYEVHAAGKNLLELESFSEFEKTYKQRTDLGRDPLDVLVETLQTEVCDKTGAAVLIERDRVTLTPEELGNPDMHGVGHAPGQPYHQTGIDPQAKGLLEARAAASPVGTKTDRTDPMSQVPVGRTDDIVAQLADPLNWGVAAPLEDAPAPTLPPRIRDPFAPPSPSTYVSGDTIVPDPAPPAKAPPWKLGKVTEVPYGELLPYVYDNGRTARPKVASVKQQGNTLLFEWGSSVARWSGGYSTLEGDATSWLNAQVQSAVDQRAGAAEVLIADTEGIVDLDLIAQIIPTVVLEEAR